MFTQNKNTVKTGHVNYLLFKTKDEESELPGGGGRWTWDDIWGQSSPRYLWWCTWLRGTGCYLASLEPGEQSNGELRA